MLAQKLAVNIFTMSDFNNPFGKHIIADSINHTVHTHPYGVIISFTPQFFVTPRVQIISKSNKGILNFMRTCFKQRKQCLLCAIFQIKRICHLEPSFLLNFFSVSFLGILASSLQLLMAILSSISLVYSTIVSYFFSRSNTIGHLLISAMLNKSLAITQLFFTKVMNQFNQNSTAAMLYPDEVC